MSVKVSQAVRHYGGIRLRAIRRGLPALPPGRYNPLSRGRLASPRALLDKFHRYGSVFKTSWERHLLTCIVGNDIARDFFRDNDPWLEGIAQDLKPLFDGEDVRLLDGDLHRKCKVHLSRAVGSSAIGAWEAEIRAYTTARIDEHRRQSLDDAPTGDRLSDAMRIIATGMLIMLQFGASPSSATFHALLAGYEKYGRRLVWNIGPAQIEAHREIERVLDDARAGGAAEDPGGDHDGRRGLPSGAWTRDPLVMGNLIYMIEMGRHDLAALLKWIVSMLTDNPSVADRIVAEGPQGSEGSCRLAQATVLETLRLFQSEALVRLVKKDITFRGHLIPRGSFVRICLWEAHKNPDVFADPFRFDPDRFSGRIHDIDTYAPFGLDKHRCVAADSVVRLASLFVEELVHGFSWTATGNGKPVLLFTLWEPSPDFAIRLDRRGSSAQG